MRKYIVFILALFSIYSFSHKWLITTVFAQSGSPQVTTDEKAVPGKQSETKQKESANEPEAVQIEATISEPNTTGNVEHPVQPADGIKLNKETEGQSATMNSEPLTVTVGNIKYYLDSQKRITHSEVYKSDRVEKIQQFHPGSTIENAQKSIKYIFHLNTSGHITKASMLDAKSQNVINEYTYYAYTVFGSHAQNIQYKFTINNDGHLINASKYEKRTKRVLNLYTYYNNTIYGNHGNRIKYGFSFNTNGHLSKAYKREAGTKRLTNWYNYYSGTIYGKHEDKIRYRFDIDKNGYLSKAIEKEKGTARLLTTYKYKPKTRYGRHAEHISERILNVPVISQLPSLPTGCEITAVTMMLRYKGSKVGHVTLAREMPKHHSNPNLGYVGNPFAKSGWTIYPPALKKLVKKYSGSSTILTGKTNATLEKQLRNKKPVVIWASRMHGFSVHAITLTGYNSSYYYYNDPWIGKKNVKIKKTDFNRLWSNQKKRAISL
ncbi:C39 family peptidase [Aciduricibacillus chroicocephali]|uniref:C39 family peptidase n=1 Tax=Aciduricibacillus chroicocephali TaxID=3054939 RepID=A0ABY9KWJ4_9BACI|nr:C39 family peptidase [Bacillaceae bacterium 44XB]